MKAKVPFLLTKNQEKAFHKEVNRQLGESVDELVVKMEYIIFRQVHKRLHVGAKKMRELYDSIRPEMEKLREYYEMDAGDEVFLCKHELDSIGINISEWHKQNPAVMVDFNKFE